MRFNTLKIHQNLLKLKITGKMDETVVLRSLSKTHYSELVQQRFLEKEKSEYNTDFVEEFLESIGTKYG